MKTNELIAILRDEDDPNVLDYIQEAADTLQLQKVRIMELETELEKAKAERRWIPVTERLPERMKDVLVIRMHGEPDIEFMFYDGTWVGDTEGKQEVTHWMPLPEPPKEGA